MNAASAGAICLRGRPRYQVAASAMTNPSPRRMAMTPLEKFEARWTPEPNSGCWLWTGASVNNEKGCFYLDGRLWLASRVSWTLYVGPIPEGLNVLHHCDNMWCVNPGHLFLGTQLDNMRDCRNKGRIVAPGGWNKGLAMPELSAYASQRPRDTLGRFGHAL